MRPDSHPAGVNIFYLEQGAALIRRLDDRYFGSTGDGPSRGGVGAQFRHCFDFYDCFLAGLTEGKIDYNLRRRDTRLESDRTHALKKIEAIAAALRNLDAPGVSRSLAVRAESGSGGAPEWNDSSGGRELQFLLSHTVHHYALIAVMLRLQGYDVASEQPEFGVAPSTLAHWKETGSFVS